MHTIIHPMAPSTRSQATEPTSPVAFRQPNYDYLEHPDTITLVVYVPGVDAAGVEIEARGSDLTVTAKKKPSCGSTGSPFIWRLRNAIINSVCGSAPVSTTPQCRLKLTTAFSA